MNAALFAGAAAASVLPGYRAVGQGTATNLCWAAAAETAWSALSSSGPSACDIVATSVDPTCCLPGDQIDIARCDEPTQWYHDYLPGVLKSRRRGVADPVKGRLAVDLNLLHQEIEVKHRPVAVWWKYANGCDTAGHIVTVVGLDEGVNPLQLLVVDPRPGNAVSMSLQPFQCGPVGEGQCAVYHAMNGGAVVSGPVVEDALPTCPQREIGGLASIDSNAVATTVQSRLGQFAGALGLGGPGTIGCSDSPIAVEYTRTPGTQHFLVRCTKGGAAGTRFVAAAVPHPVPQPPELLWFGASALAARIEEAARGLGVGPLILRIDPETGRAVLTKPDGSEAPLPP